MKKTKIDYNKMPMDKFFKEQMRLSKKLPVGKQATKRKPCKVCGTYGVCEHLW